MEIFGGYAKQTCADLLYPVSRIPRIPYPTHTHIPNMILHASMQVYGAWKNVVDQCILIFSSK